jgi:hypothetical protein
LFLNDFIQIGVRDFPAFLEHLAESFAFHSGSLVAVSGQTGSKGAPALSSRVWQSPRERRGKRRRVCLSSNDPGSRGHRRK